MLCEQWRASASLTHSDVQHEGTVKECVCHGPALLLRLSELTGCLQGKHMVSRSTGRALLYLPLHELVEKSLHAALLHATCCPLPQASHCFCSPAHSQLCKSISCVWTTGKQGNFPESQPWLRVGLVCPHRTCHSQGPCCQVHNGGVHPVGVELSGTEMTSLGGMCSEEAAPVIVTVWH